MISSEINPLRIMLEHSLINRDWEENKYKFREIQARIKDYKSSELPGDLTEFFFGKNGPYKLTKRDVMRLIRSLFIPLEKSYYCLNDVILLKWSGIDTIEELPELQVHRGIKDPDQLYQILGYEEQKI